MGIEYALKKYPLCILNWTLYWSVGRSTSLKKCQYKIWANHSITYWERFPVYMLNVLSVFMFWQNNICIKTFEKYINQSNFWMIHFRSSNQSNDLIFLMLWPFSWYLKNIMWFFLYSEPGQSISKVSYLNVKYFWNLLIRLSFSLPLNI